jgi:hypothetical protein
VPAKTKKPNKYQDIILAFLFEEPSSRGAWAKEMKMAVALEKEHSYEFLIAQKGKVKMPSLAWFYTDNGKKFVKDVKSYINLSFGSESFDLQDQPVAPESEVKKKPSSLKEFLNIYNKYGKT